MQVLSCGYQLYWQIYSSISSVIFLEPKLVSNMILSFCEMLCTESLVYYIEVRLTWTDRFSCQIVFCSHLGLCDIDNQTIRRWFNTSSGTLMDAYIRHNPLKAWQLYTSKQLQQKKKLILSHLGTFIYRKKKKQSSDKRLYVWHKVPYYFHTTILFSYYFLNSSILVCVWGDSTMYRGKVFECLIFEGNTTRTYGERKAPIESYDNREKTHSTLTNRVHINKPLLIYVKRSAPLSGLEKKHLTRYDCLGFIHAEILFETKIYYYIVDWSSSTSNAENVKRL